MQAPGGGASRLDGVRPSPASALSRRRHGHRFTCPWLIRRFIDPIATFDYVPTAQVLTEAAARGAVPYDLPGAAVTHRGERCSFDALLEDFALHDAALDRLANIVRGADTDRLDLAPQSAGLLAASLGLSKQYPNDHAM